MKIGQVIKSAQGNQIFTMVVVAEKPTMFIALMISNATKESASCARNTPKYGIKISVKGKVHGYDQNVVELTNHFVSDVIPDFFKREGNISFEDANKIYKNIETL